MLRRGHPAYVISLPGRGDAGRTTAEKEVRPVADEAFWFNIWRMGDWPQHHSGSQFPQDEASLNQFFRQMTPDLSGGVMADDVAAIGGMAVRAGGGVLVTHSAGGLPGWLAAMRNEAVSGVAAYEPGGFVFPEGEAPAPMPGATGALAGVEVSVALNAGFEAGLSLNEAKELVGQLYAYCGFPRALNAAATLMAVADERTAAGKRPAEGPVNSPLPSGSSRDFGRENQTRLCGREVKGALFDFHPQLDEYLKAHLFGDIFARDSVSWRIREIVTIAALAARRETEPQMKSHIGVGRINGISGAQAAEILHLVRCPEDPALLPPDRSAFPVGEPNAAYARYFTGRSFLAPIFRAQQNISAVTFAPGCRNNWHIHHAGKDGGQILMVTAGEGYYQEWGKPARRLRKGDKVNIPAGVRHWHGAAPDSWFQHLAVEVPGVDCHTEWLEPVSAQAYAAAVK